MYRALRLLRDDEADMTADNLHLQIMEAEMYNVERVKMTQSGRGLQEYLDSLPEDVEVVTILPTAGIYVLVVTRTPVEPSTEEE